MSIESTVNYTNYTNDCLIVDVFYKETLKEIVDDNCKILSSNLYIPSSDEISCLEDRINNFVQSQNNAEYKKFQRTKAFIQKYMNK